MISISEKRLHDLTKIERDILSHLTVSQDSYMAYVLKENPSKTMCWIAQTQHDNKNENTEIIAWALLRWYSPDIRSVSCGYISLFVNPVNVSIQVISLSKQTQKVDFKISISDTGIGMDEMFLNHLFEAFVQHEKAKNKKYQGTTGLGLAITHRLVSMPGTDGEEGTGLGLLICKDFLKKNNGNIWTESEVGKGTHFHLTLPRNV